MAFDGICVAAVVRELNERLNGGRITKIAQPEKDEITVTVKNETATERLFINVSAGMPFCYLTDENKPSPMTAPNFCMVLRKHLQGGRIIGIEQPGLERVIRIRVEHLDEMGDLCERVLIFELMGKHSNLILTDQGNTVLDAIKHVSAMVSSVREVLPGREYFIPFTEEKTDPLLCLRNEGEETLRVKFDEAMNKPLPVFKRIYSGFTGLSPSLAMEMCNASGVDGERDFTEESGKDALFDVLLSVLAKVEEGDYTPAVLYENGRIRDFCVLFPGAEGRPGKTGAGAFGDVTDGAVFYESVSEMLMRFYSDKNKADVMRNKTADLRHHLQTILERDYKKADLQQKQMKDAGNREKYRIYGELLNAYGHEIKEGAKQAEVFDYYENQNRIIPLDPTKTASENAVRYYEKYNKLKRTEIALTEQIRENEEEIEYLEGIMTFITIASTEEDLMQIRAELAERGYVKRIAAKGKNGGRGKSGKMPKAKPLHYRTPDGYDIYVGRNNLQNETVTFDIATGNDWWFHAKGVPGSHVVVKCSFANQAEEWDMPDEIFELAGAIALVNSKNKDMEKAEVDYLRRKNVKRPNKAAPGFVVYYTNYSLVAKTDLSGYVFVKM